MLKQLPSKTLHFLFCSSLFLCFPLALLFPQNYKTANTFLSNLWGNREIMFNGFLFELPWISLLSFLSLAYLICKPPRFLSRSKAPFFLLISYFSFTLFSSFIHQSSPSETMSSLSFLLIPLASALLFKQKFEFSKAFFLIWLINLSYFYFLNAPTGISGNKNWLIAISLACALSAQKHLSQIFYFLLKKHPKANSFSVLLSFIITWSISLHLLVQTTSRAAYLAFFIALYFYVFRGLPKFTKRFTMGLLTLSLLAMSIFAYKNYAQLTHNELRPVLWKGSLKMSLHSPLFGTAGPDQFSNRFPSYRLSEQFLLPISAPNSSHPHNEILLSLCEIGYPATIALILFFFLLLRHSQSHYTYPFIILLSCSFFDKILHQPQGQIIFLISLGALISPRLKTGPPPHHFQKLASTCLCLLGCFLFVQQSRASWQHRLGSNLELRALQNLDISKKKELAKKALVHYQEAAKLQPSKAKYNYKATNTALHFLQDENQAAHYLNRLIKQAPDFLNTNRLLCYFNELLAYRSSNTKEKTQYLHFALLANQEEERVNGYRLDNQSDCMLFYLRHKWFNQAEESYNKILTQSQTLANYQFFNNYTPLVKDWYNAVKYEDLHTAITIANQLRGGIKGLRYLDPLYTKMAPPLYLQTTPLKTERFSEVDYYYWRDYVILQEFVKDCPSFNDGIEKILAIPSAQNEPFQSIDQILKSQKANPLSRCAMIAQYCNNYAYPNIIISNQSGLTLNLVKTPNEYILINPQSKRASPLKNRTILEQIKQGKLKSLTYYHPQCFFSANTYLFSLYKSVFTEQSIQALSPSLQWVKNKETFGCKTDFLPQIFFTLKQQVKTP